MHRQSPVKNQPINHKVDNSYVLTKVPTTREKLKQEQKFPNIKVLCDNYYYQANHSISEF